MVRNPQRKSLNLTVSIINFPATENLLIPAIQKVAFVKQWKNLVTCDIHHPKRNDAKKFASHLKAWIGAFRLELRPQG